MNTNPTNVEQHRVIAQAAASYTPPEPQSHALLMPHRESIAMLRGKGASYRAIAKILATVQIRVSLDTLSRFCREMIDPKPARKSGRRSGKSHSIRRMGTSLSEPRPSQETPGNPPPEKDAKAAEPATPPRGKGPRIADIDNI